MSAPQRLPHLIPDLQRASPDDDSRRIECGVAGIAEVDDVDSRAAQQSRGDPRIACASIRIQHFDGDGGSAVARDRRRADIAAPAREGPYQGGGEWQSLQGRPTS